LSPPDPLPLPPADPSELAAFPEIKDDWPEVLYRVHRVDLGPRFFSFDQEWRWNPPADSTEAFGACYTSTTPIGAYIETFSDLPIITQAEIDRRALSHLRLPPEARWADMTNPAIVGEWGLDVRISTGDDYDTCQAWAQQLFAAGFTGIYYQARHDVAARGRSASVVLFGDPGAQPSATDTLRTAEIPSDVVEAGRLWFHLQVHPEVPLPSRPDEQPPLF
jgi:hypothetical protein